MNDSDSAIEARADALVEDHERLLRGLVAHRKAHDVPQEVVAERMGVTQPTVASFERYDANPTLATIRRYALAVGLRLSTRLIDDCGKHNETPRAVDVERMPSFAPFVPSFHDDNHDEWTNTPGLLELTAGWKAVR